MPAPAPRRAPRLGLEPLEARDVASASPLVVSGPEDGRVTVFTADPSAPGRLSAAGTVVQAFVGLGVNVRTTTADVDGDGVKDLVGVAGPGGYFKGTVISGADQKTVLVPPFFPFAGSEDFGGGGFVAASDLDGDGRAELVVTPDDGGGPRVAVFSLGRDGMLRVRADFFGIDDPNYRGGARVSLGDVTRDGTADLAVAAGFLGGPRVALFDGKSLTGGGPTRVVNDFFAFPGDDAVTLRNGVFVALGDVDGDGAADFVFGGGPGGAPRVFAVSGGKVLKLGVAAAQASPLANFFVGGDAGDRGGVHVSASDVDGDGRADVLVGSGAGARSRARVYAGAQFAGPGEPAAYQDLDPYNAVLPAGVYVG